MHNYIYLNLFDALNLLETLFNVFQSLFTFIHIYLLNYCIIFVAMHNYIYLNLFDALKLLETLFNVFQTSKKKFHLCNVIHVFSCER